MRFMILLKADKDTEAGVMPSGQLLADMGKFNEELIKSGIMQAGEGLHPTSKGARVYFADGEVTVADGPFPLTGQELAGFRIWKCDSKQAAIEWARKVPMPMASGEAEIEIRQIFDAEDFGAEFTPELREQEERQRAQIEAQQQQ
ncbi:MAG: YciI family protein [Massilia sp.]|nr:YciI family protein [Massilia sp.]